jgi:hypothetical protein
MRNSIKIVLIVIILAVVGGIFYLKRNELSMSTPTPTPSATATPSTNPIPISDLIQVTTPVSGQQIDINPISSAKSMVLVSGKARGSWYFEASFPVKILDAYGNILAEDSIQTSENWMTEDFVPFAKEIGFTPPSTLTGTVILMNDNPSGDPAKSRELQIPIKFNISTTTVKAYFGSETKNPGAIDCSLVYPVTRTIAKISQIARASLEELLKGPTDAEKNDANKYYTLIPSGVKIKSLNIDSKGVAKVDFDSALEQGVGGSCRVSAIRSQITQTLKQFTTVKSVVISIDGRTEDILQP